MRGVEISNRSRVGGRRAQHLATFQASQRRGSHVPGAGRRNAAGRAAEVVVQLGFDDAGKKSLYLDASALQLVRQDCVKVVMKALVAA